MLEALKVYFQKEDESLYNPEFVAKIKKSLAELKNGNVSRIKDQSDILAIRAS